MAANNCALCNKKFGMFDDTISKDIDGEAKEVHRVCATKIAMRSANSEAALSAPKDSLQEQPIQNRTAKPSIIDILSTLGIVLFVMTGLSGLFLIAQDGGGILGVSLIIAGVFQLSIFLGFSAIIDQLYKINVNTAKSDKSDT